MAAMRNASVMPLFLFFMLLGSTAPTLSLAQSISVDATSLMQRLNQLESRLQAAERQKATPMAPIVTGGQAAPTGGSGYLMNDLNQRLTEMERQQDAQVGAQERLTFAIERLAKRLDDLQRDYEMRLTTLEGRTAQALAPSATPTPTALPAAATGVPDGLSSTIVYQRGYAYIAAGDYPNANLWLTTFLQRFPTDAMTENAYYWLGEVQLVQNNPRAAAQSFRDALKAFPKGAKAAGNLLKLGIALNQLGQPQLAKGAWDKLLKDYPAAPEAIRAKDELTKLSMAKSAATPAASAAPISPSTTPLATAPR